MVHAISFRMSEGELSMHLIPFIIYKVVKYRKILLIYNVYFIFSLVKI